MRINRRRRRAEADPKAIVRTRPHGIVLPKAEGGASVAELTRRLAEAGNATAKILAIATETPSAMFALGSYGGHKRLVGLTWGAEDLPAAIGAATSREEDGRYTAPYELAAALCPCAARGGGVAPIETVYRPSRTRGAGRYAGGRGARLRGNDGDPPDQIAPSRRFTGRARSPAAPGRGFRGRIRSMAYVARRADDRPAAPRSSQASSPQPHQLTAPVFPAFGLS